MVHEEKRMNARSHPASTKSGALKKYLGIFEGWQMGYFRLERCYLHYFRHKEAATPVESLTRGNITHSCPTTLGRFPKMDNVFKVEMKSGKTWFLQASSAEEMNQWIKAIAPARHSFLSHQGSHSSAASPSQHLSSRTSQENEMPPYTMNTQARTGQDTGGCAALSEQRITRTVSPPPPYTEYDYYSQPPAASNPQSTSGSREGWLGLHRTEHCIVS